MSLEHNTEIFHEALLSLVGPFWGKPKIASLIRCWTYRIQELEDATWDVLERYTVEGADDARLAVLGRVVGQPNFGWDTEVYRAVLRGKIRANRSRGLIVDLVEVIQAVTPTDDVIHVVAHGNATMSVWTDAPVDEDTHEALAFLLSKTRAAGVGMTFYWSEGGSDEMFIWDESNWDDAADVWPGADVL